MQKERLLQRVIWAVATLLPLAAFAVLQLRPSWDIEWRDGHLHFYVVSAVAALVAVFAAAVALAGRRLRNVQVTLLALAFVSLAGVFAVHGLTTPGVLMGNNPVISIAAHLSVFLAALFLALAATPSNRPWALALARHHTWAVGGWLALLGLFAVTAVSRPSFYGWMVVHLPPYSWILTVITVSLSVSALRGFARAYRFSRLPLQAALALAAGWVGGAQVIMEVGVTWTLGWWIYHVLLLLAALAMLWGLARQYGTGGGVVQAIGGVFLTDPLARLEAGYSAGVAALVAATEARDPYTAGHSFRVARLAVRIGEKLGLSPEQLRALGQGGILHDIGKIVVPDTVLNKPGRLTPEERRLVEQHPVQGFEIARRIGTLKAELDVILYHHERWDGRGYPEGRSGVEIPLLARVLAVADVYDAITSERAYRAPWSEGEAREYILNETGRQFDPACIKAWAAVMSTAEPLPRLQQAAQLS